jgi:MaoC dehydratase-like protein
MIDRSLVGTEEEPHTVDVERGRLRLFAKAIGEEDAVYSDVATARAAGHPDLPVPPTFLFCLEMERSDPFGFLTSIGVDLRRVLHGEQAFAYERLAYAGDRLTFASRITDVYARKGGALEFLVRETDVTRDGEPVARLTSTTVVRNPEAGA